ncbi:hypothetical protein [Streptomyces fodineus]|nr:hypothetical protein [Streptomyces fodineus]
MLPSIPLPHGRFDQPGGGFLCAEAAPPLFPLPGSMGLLDATKG